MTSRVLLRFCFHHSIIYFCNMQVILIFNSEWRINTWLKIIFYYFVYYKFLNLSKDTVSACTLIKCWLIIKLTMLLMKPNIFSWDIKNMFSNITNNLYPLLLNFNWNMLVPIFKYHKMGNKFKSTHFNEIKRVNHTKSCCLFRKTRRCK